MHIAPPTPRLLRQSTVVSGWAKKKTEEPTHMVLLCLARLNLENAADEVLV